ncbi:MAG: DUF2630 family protein [Actinomycetes bacterium]
MADPGLHDEIGRLVAAEHELRSRIASSGAADEDRAELTRIEASLDQCWDLLRQRDAKREFGDDPGAAEPRDVGTVEGYLQ